MEVCIVPVGQNYHPEAIRNGQKPATIRVSEEPRY